MMDLNEEVLTNVLVKNKNCKPNMAPDSKEEENIVTKKAF